MFDGLVVVGLVVVVRVGRRRGIWRRRVERVPCRGQPLLHVQQRHLGMLQSSLKGQEGSTKSTLSSLKSFSFVATPLQVCTSVTAIREFSDEIFSLFRSNGGLGELEVRHGRFATLDRSTKCEGQLTLALYICALMCIAG